MVGAGGGDAVTGAVTVRGDVGTVGAVAGRSAARAASDQRPGPA